jgi:putative phosphonate transport system ATP-binding protein
MNAVAKVASGEAETAPLLKVAGLSKWYGHVLGCRDVSFEMRAGEILGIVGESGSGKTTLLNCVSGKLAPSSGSIEFDTSRFGLTNVYALSEPDRRRMQREDWGFVHQNPRDGLRMRVSGGANVAEPLMNLGARHYGRMRQATIEWLERVELDTARIDDRPANFSGGMQQRIQVARNLIHRPRLVFMDEPTGGLDVSVQARLLDLLRELVRDLRLAVIIVTHDLAVARLMADRLMVMKGGLVVETGLTDQVLDDPQHPYTQTLVSSVLQI